MSFSNPPQNYEDPHRYNRNVHYRLYSSSHGPTVICVQDFDYEDYDCTKFLSTEAWDEEADAKAALETWKRHRDGKLMLRALVAEELKPGDVVDVVQDPLVGTLTVVKYRPPFD